MLPYAKGEIMVDGDGESDCDSAVNSDGISFDSS